LVSLRPEKHCWVKAGWDDLTLCMSGAFGFGALSIACIVAAVFCLSYWRSSGDRSYVLFAVGYGLVGLSWIALAIVIGFDRVRP
jgi:hypothetical protein